MIRTAAILGALSLGLVAVPASAASEPFIAGAAAYEEGSASTMKPEEQAEFAYCAGYWNLWVEALNDSLVAEEDLAVLSPVLQDLSAPFQTIGWFTKLKEADKFNAEIDEGEAEARMFLAGALAGDVQAGKNLFGTLGACEL